MCLPALCPRRPAQIATCHTFRCGAAALLHITRAAVQPKRAARWRASSAASTIADVPAATCSSRPPVMPAGQQQPPALPRQALVSAAPTPGDAPVTRATPAGLPALLALLARLWPAGHYLRCGARRTHRSAISARGHCSAGRVTSRDAGGPGGTGRPEFALIAEHPAASAGESASGTRWPSTVVLVPARLASSHQTPSPARSCSSSWARAVRWAPQPAHIHKTAQRSVSSTCRWPAGSGRAHTSHPAPPCSRPRPDLAGRASTPAGALAPLSATIFTLSA
jgi:hypothetical protein